MTEKTQIKSVALFFFFSLLDEELARVSSRKVLRSLDQATKKKENADSNDSALVVHFTYQVWKKLCSKKGFRGRNVLTFEAGWLLPDFVDIGPWMQFQKDVDDDELLAVIWSRIIKLSDEDISKGLGVTVGTVRHRVARGLRQLSLAGGWGGLDV